MKENAQVDAFRLELQERYQLTPDAKLRAKTARVAELREERLPQLDLPDARQIHDAFLTKFSADDAGNAQAVKELYGEHLLYTDAYGWLVWNNTHWKADQDRVTHFVVDTLLRRRVAAVEAGKEKVVEASRANEYRLKGCLTFLRAYVKEDVENFDNNSDELNVLNGVLNMRTGTLTPHDYTQRFTYCLPVAYNPDADSSKWVSFLNSVVKEPDVMVKFVQTAVGYTLTGHISEECLFYIFGPTRSGKGTFVEVLRALLGIPLAAETGFSTFTTKRDGQAQNFDLAPLKPARLVVASESNKNERLNGAMVKNITGGGQVSCAFKFRDYFTYLPQFKIWLTTNYTVNGDADDSALWNRLRVIEFPNSFEDREDTTLKQRLKERENLEGVLLWAVQGAMQWYEKGKLDVPEISKQTRKEHREQADSVGLWIEECCVVGYTERVVTHMARSSYSRWCEENEFRPKGAKMFNDSLRRRGITPNHTERVGVHTQKVVLGLGLQSA